jgi:uncharacterized protein
MLVCSGLIALAASAWREAAAQQPSAEIVTRKNVMVPMRDGVKLATDIYLPGHNGAAGQRRFPVVLSRTPYGKGGSLADAKYFVPRGYVVIGQDTRGRGDSEGTWHWMTDDRQDGYDTIEWIARQPWSGLPAQGVELGHQQCGQRQRPSARSRRESGP